MADIRFYRSHFGITTQKKAFEKFTSTLQNYYGASFYVHWEKIFASIKRYERELALLSTLCNKPNKKQATQDLLEAYPQVISVLPILMGCRGTVTLVEDAAGALVSSFDFISLGPKYALAEAERYAGFIVASGIIELLEHIGSVPDYVLGVEVGMDTNARKNRGGDCGIQAISPLVVRAEGAIESLRFKTEATYQFLSTKGFSLPDGYQGVKWDYCFWIGDKHDRLVLMEVNHYGAAGSKPPAIAREYAARHATLKRAGIGFIWVTDGLGWRSMRNPLSEAFAAIDYVVNIKLASEGQLEAALQSLLID